MTFRSAVFATGIFLGLMSGAAEAAYVASFTQVAGGVQAVGTGEFRTDFLNELGLVNLSAGVDPSHGIFAFTSNAFPDNFTYTGVFTGATSFGDGHFTSATSKAGDVTAFNFDAQEISELSVPRDYVPGTMLNSTMFFAGATFASLGLTPGTYTYTYVNQNTSDSSSSFSVLAAQALSDTVVVRVGTVPLPPSAPMFGTALLALGAAGYATKRKKEAAAA